jgi:hypothetical protein
MASDQRGAQPELMHLVVYPASNYQITNNILWLTDGVNTLVTNENVAGCSGSGNKAFVDCALKNHNFAGNVVIPGWTNSAVPSGAVDPASACTNYGGTWKGSSCSGGLIPNLVTGPSVAARLASIKLRSDGGLQFDSPYASKGTDGRDPGADLNVLNQAQGLIGPGNASGITSTSVTFQVRVPDPGAACIIGYGLSSDPTTWSRTAANTDKSIVRTITLTSLQSSKAYFGEVWCAGAPPRALPPFSTL